MVISVILPVFNEEKSLGKLTKKLVAELNRITSSWEIVFVNDGSTDKSFEKLSQLSKQNKKIKIVDFERNFGQTAALMAGFEFAKGKILVTMDSDLQNDPADISKLVKKLQAGYSVVSGWRKQREDNVLLRKIPSKIANYLISKVTGVRLHDYGCTLKVYRASVIKNINLYGEMHRYIPLYVNNLQTTKIAEVPVKHHKRLYGESKYGVNRIIKVILDLILVEFLFKYSQKPIYIFGLFGIISIFLSFVSFLITLYFKFFGSKSFIETPLPLLVVLFFIVGFQLILMGLISEMLMRTYYESQKKKVYSVRKLINISK